MLNTKNTPRLVAKGKSKGTATGGTMRWIIATALEDADHTNATFKASWTEDLTGGPDGYSVVVDSSVAGNENDPNALTVNNLHFGVIYDPSNSSTTIPSSSELIFALKRGMRMLAFLRDDGTWQAVQMGGVLENYTWAGP